MMTHRSLASGLCMPVKFGTDRSSAITSIRASEVRTSAAGRKQELRLFIDSANLDAWKRWLPTGVFHGVTTDPLLLEQASIPCQGKSLRVLAQQAIKLGANQVHLTTWGRSVDELIRNGSELSNIDSAIVVQVPLTYMGLRAAKKLVDVGTRISLIISSIRQVILSLTVKAEYVVLYSPLNTSKSSNSVETEHEPSDSKQAVEELIRLHQVINNANCNTRLLVRGMSMAEELVLLAEQKLDCFTLQPSLIEDITADPNIDILLKQFESTYPKNPYNLFF